MTDTKQDRTVHLQITRELYEEALCNFGWSIAPFWRAVIRSWEASEARMAEPDENARIARLVDANRELSAKMERRTALLQWTAALDRPTMGLIGKIREELATDAPGTKPEQSAVEAKCKHPYGFGSATVSADGFVSSCRCGHVFIDTRKMSPEKRVVGQFEMDAMKHELGQRSSGIGRTAIFSNIALAFGSSVAPWETSGRLFAQCLIPGCHS